jgi:hypothetical protein
MFVVAAAVIAFINLSPTNGHALEVLIVVAIGGNAMEHLSAGGSIREKLVAWRAGRDSGAVGADPGSEEIEPEED